jgi:hypothetical protein
MPADPIVAAGRLLPKPGDTSSPCPPKRIVTTLSVVELLTSCRKIYPGTTEFRFDCVPKFFNPLQIPLAELYCG